MQSSQSRAIVGQVQVEISTPVLDKKPSIRQNLGEGSTFSVGGGSTIEAAVDPGRMHPCSQVPSSKRLTGVPGPRAHRCLDTNLLQGDPARPSSQPSTLGHG